MNNIVVFTGAGISKESGMNTFRDSDDGLWNNHKIEEVCTIEGWKNDPGKVLDFCNGLRRNLANIQPNDAHKDLVELEKYFNVTVVTQNVDDLHEKGGSSNIIHIHGQLTKAISSFLTGNTLRVVLDGIDIGYNDINIGDLDEKYAQQLRPDVVLFGEYPIDANLAYNSFLEADIILIIGTSLPIGYTLKFFTELKQDVKIYYIDPKPCHDLDVLNLNIQYIKKKASIGVKEIVDKLIKEK